MSKTRDPRKVEMGLRIAKAREEAGLTQDELAERVGVTYQAVSRWELGDTSPRDKSAYQLIANATKKTVPWILYGVDPEKNDASFPPSVEVGQIVPSVAPKNITRFLSGDNTVVEGYVRTHYPCGGRSFRTLVTDMACFPELVIGDVVVIDPDAQPRPDDFVAILYKGEPTIRVYSEETDEFEFLPLNRRHAKIVVKSLDEVLIGVVSETGKPRRRVPSPQ